MLDFPLHEGFFPQIALTADELRAYKRLGRERVAQLVRVIEDADCAYKWTDVRVHGAFGGAGASTRAHCQKAQFLDFNPASKVTVASTLLKASVTLPDARVDEVLAAIAKSRTKDFRKTMRYLHGPAFVDGRTLFTFPTSTATAKARPPYSYRAIKWHVMRTSSSSASASSNDATTLDFAYLEYAGKRRPPPGSSVVGFCVQESIVRERELPTLAGFGVARGVLSRSGLVLSRTHQASVLKLTAICQVDGDVSPSVRATLERVLQASVCASVARVHGLLDRQRVSSLRFVEQWQWVPNADRKACAVCLRGFYFHRKHHCRTCGEVVCSSCAPFRELEEPIFDIAELRVCSNCMAGAGAAFAASSSFETTEAAQHESSATSHGDTESYVRALRSPVHNAYEDMAFEMREQPRDRRRRSDNDSDSDNVLAIRDRQPPLEQHVRYRNTTIAQPHEKMEALTNVVSRIRDVRDTINLSISEADFDDVDNKNDNNDNNGDNDEIFNDVRARMHRIRATLESSVHNFDAALANATHAPVYARKRRSTRTDGSVATATSDSHSKKTRHTEAENDPRPRHRHVDDIRDIHDMDDMDDRDVLARTKHSDDSGTDDNVMTPEQFASVARITFAAARATKQAGEAFLSSCGSDVGGRPSDVDDDASVRTPDSVATGYSDGSQDPYASSNYERVMASFQDEKRRRRDFEGDGDGDSATHGGMALYDSHQQPPPLKRTKSINANPLVSRRANEILELERRIEELQRSLEDAQRKLSVFEIEEPDPEQRGPLEVVYEESAQVEIESVFEVFGNRSDDSDSNSDNDSGRRESFTGRPSLSHDKLVTTYDLVTELRGVMNSSEVTKPSGRRSFTKPPPSPLPEHSSANQYQYQQRQSLPSFGAGVMPSPIPHRKNVHLSPSGSVDGGHTKPKHADVMDNTASSSASNPHHSFTSSNGVFVGSHVNADTSLESTQYRLLMGSAQMLLGDDDDDNDNSDSSSDDDYEDVEPFVMTGMLEEPKLRVRTPELSAPEPPFFARRELEPASPDALKHKPGEQRRHTAGERDESDELRRLIEGLGRPRSNSVPFRDSNQLSGAPTADTAPKPSLLPPYEKPAWSDTVPNRVQSAYHVEQTLREVRSCLSSFLVECPSGRDRERKLSSIFRVLRSLHREGVRSKFRTLNHDDIRYAKVVRETPSLIRLLKLAGYVSLPHKLTMRHVDQPYIGVILREIQADLKH